MPVSGLLADNIELLSSALGLVEGLDDATYARVFEDLTDGSIGDHIRHVLDGYATLTGGFREGVLDYDARARDPRVATSTAHAERALREQITRLQELKDIASIPVEVRVATSAERDRAALPSSLARELAFVHSHAVHHFAIIAMLLRAAGRPPNPEFGVAPSTLRYRRAVG